MKKEEELWSYKHVFESVIVNACKNSNLVQTSQTYQDLFLFLKLNFNLNI